MSHDHLVPGDVTIRIILLMRLLMVKSRNGHVKRMKLIFTVLFNEFLAENTGFLPFK